MNYLSNQNAGLARRLAKPIINSYQDRNTEPVHNSALWNIEQELSRALGKGGQSDRSRIYGESNDSTPYSTIGSSAGIKLNELMAERGRRKSSQLLKRSLRYSTRSPYSVWPGGRPVVRDPENYASVRHRPNYPAKFESTGF